MQIIGGKWKPIIIYCLSFGKLRFGKLNQMIPAISNKVLSQQLKELHEDGIIERVIFDSNLQKIEYTLSEFGKTLMPVINELCRWGQENQILTIKE
jgi:DNA-binding HxlR family transcriptional regulator